MHNNRLQIAWLRASLKKRGRRGEKVAFSTLSSYPQIIQRDCLSSQKTLTRNTSWKWSFLPWELTGRSVPRKPGLRGNHLRTLPVNSLSLKALVCSVPHSSSSLTLSQCLWLSYLMIPCVLGEMVRQARILAQATSDLVNAIKADAEGESDLENSRKLLSAAKILADATAKMVEAAKVQRSFLYRP